MFSICRNLLAWIKERLGVVSPSAHILDTWKANTPLILLSDLYGPNIIIEVTEEGYADLLDKPTYARRRILKTTKLRNGNLSVTVGNIKRSPENED